MKRMTREAEFGMTFGIPKTHAQEEGRLVRCLHGSRRKYKTGIRILFLSIQIFSVPLLSIRILIIKYALERVSI